MVVLRHHIWDNPGGHTGDGLCRHPGGCRPVGFPAWVLVVMVVRIIQQMSVTTALWVSVRTPGPDRRNQAVMPDNRCAATWSACVNPILECSRVGATHASPMRVHSRRRRSRQDVLCGPNGFCRARHASPLHVDLRRRCCVFQGDACVARSRQQCPRVHDFSLSLNSIGAGPCSLIFCPCASRMIFPRTSAQIGSSLPPRSTRITNVTDAARP